MYAWGEFLLISDEIDYWMIAVMFITQRPSTLMEKTKNMQIYFTAGLKLKQENRGT